jgi:flagellar basal body P-ring protein FlgI
LIYRYNFPSIDTYTAFVGVNSITNIVNNTFAFTQEADIISYTEITGDVVVEGDLTVENIIVGSNNLVIEINTKQNIIQDGGLSISKTLNLQS